MLFGLLALPETGPLELSASMVSSMSVLPPVTSVSFGIHYLQQWDYKG